MILINKKKKKKNLQQSYWYIFFEKIYFFKNEMKYIVKKWNKLILYIYLVSFSWSSFF